MGRKARIYTGCDFLGGRALVSVIWISRSHTRNKSKLALEFF